MAKINSIEEFRQFAADRHLPLEKMRFALGENKGNEPRWFYIYYDVYTDEYVVAKNKDTGAKFDRYRGKSESEACQILYDKMDEESRNRGLVLDPNDSKRKKDTHTYSGKRYDMFVLKLFLIPLVIMPLIGVLIFLVVVWRSEFSGYYDINGSHYYFNGYNSWYVYDEDDNDWYKDTTMKYDSSYDTYTERENEFFKDTDNGKSFYDSEYYHDYSNSSDSNSGGSYDSNSFDSWDSGDTNWSSDW